MCWKYTEDILLRSYYDLERLEELFTNCNNISSEIFLQLPENIFSPTKIKFISQNIPKIWHHFRF